jgi:AmmeMemoRadiSam system protein A
MATAEPARPASVSRPNLSAEQRRQIVACAAAHLRALVTGQTTGPADLGDVREQPVAGVFVSLKRGRHLRSCCGLIGQPVPLFHALEHATARVAREDERFPPVSPTELDHLELEVWLLFEHQPVPARGEERLTAVALGKHGVQVARGGATGLFLPSVAVDNNWDVHRLLDQVCAKAGLAPSAWRDDATALFTFEGESIRGTCSVADMQVSLDSPPPRRPGPCGAEAVQL